MRVCGNCDQFGCEVPGPAHKLGSQSGDVVQTTLLGFAFALILALVAALVGPLLIDWSTYRSEFESRASRLAGREVHITGRIDARLLPTPSVLLHGIELGDTNQKLRAGVLRLELALGALLRGELRISDAAVEQPELTLTVDERGRLEWAAPRPNFDPEAVTVERLRIQDGRANIVHKGSGSRLQIEKLEFRGELRSLIGPLKGDGSFIAAGQHYPYRLSANRLAENGGFRLRLAVDPIDRPLTAEADVSLSAEQGVPRFEGTLQLARWIGRASEANQPAIVEPWRLTALLKGDSLGAALDQLEFQYGPEERAAKLKGTARVSFAGEPHVSATLASAQMDVDRVLATSSADPVAAAKMLANALNSWPRTAVPVSLSIGIESLLFGGAAMQRVAAEVELHSDGVNVRSLEFRAPGVTQIRLNGRLGLKPEHADFAGALTIDANDARAFLSWVRGQSDAQVAIAGPLRFAGNVVTLSANQLTVDDMRLELERMALAGRLLYAQGGRDRLPRLEAALTTPEIDLDRLDVLARAVLGDAQLDFPREGTLSLAIGRATLAGIEARQTDVKARIDAHGIDIEQLSIRDFGGASLAVKGRIDTKLQPPRGTMALDLDAQSLDGVLSLLEKFKPEQAEQLRGVASRFAPLSLRATLTLDPGAAGATLAAAKFKLDALGARSFRLALIGDASTSAEVFKHDTFAALETAKVNLMGRIEAEDAQGLMQLMHLDRFVAAENRPARVTLAAKGPLDQAMDVDVQLASGALSAAAQGKLRLWGSAGRNGTLGVTIKNANVWAPRKSAGGRPADVWPTSLSARLAFEKDTLRLQDVNGTIAGVKLGGALTVGLQTPMHIEGAINLSSLDVPAAVAGAAGLPTRVANAGQRPSWPSEPFEPLFGAFKGQVELTAARVVLTPKLDARDLKGVAHFRESQLVFQVTEGTLAGGAARGELALLRTSEGLTGRMVLKVTGAEAGELFPGEGTISGRFTSELSAEGGGMSAVALLGSLHGQGTFTLENGKLARLNPGAFGTVMRAVDQGLPIDPNRLGERMDAALATGPFAVALAQGSFVIEAGQARLRNSVAGAESTELAITAGLNLVEKALDARLTFTGPEALGFANTRPQIEVLVKGPLEAPKRTVDAAQFASWLALRSVEQQSRTLDMLEGRVSPESTTASGSGAATPNPDGLAGPKSTVGEGEAASPRAKPRPRSAARKPKATAPEDAARIPRAPPPQPRWSEFLFFGPR
jgi:hypothetical protein